METIHPTPSPIGEPELDVARTLEDAALYLEHHGWCQDHMYLPVSGTLPRACALGAINMVTFHAPTTVLDTAALDGPASMHVRLVLSEFADYLDDGIWRDPDDGPAEVVWKFNDHPDATAQLVTRALRAAAKRHRALEDA